MNMNPKSYTAIEAAITPILSDWSDEAIIAWIHAGWTSDDDSAPDLDAWRKAAEEVQDELASRRELNAEMQDFLERQDRRAREHCKNGGHGYGD